MEKELAELHAALQSQNADLGTSLFDNEGFPRADIDVHGARLTRVWVSTILFACCGESD